MKPVSKREVLWYAWDWNDPASFDPHALLSLGITGVIGVASGHQFDPQNRALSLDELRGWAGELKACAGSLPVWWSFSTIRQAADGKPARSLAAPKDAAAVSQLLGNYASIGRVAREFGFVGLALDTESMAGGNIWPDEGGARDLGASLARAARQNYPALGLAAFGPLGNPPPGFVHVWRGFADGAKSTGEPYTFYTIDTYGLAHVNAKQALSHVAQVTSALPGLGWWPEGNASDAVAWIGGAAAQVKAVRAAGAGLMLYHEGGGITSDSARAAALEKVLG